MVLSDLVEILRNLEQRPDDYIAQKVENRWMKKAKIVVSTLNYCGSARMCRMKNSTAFIIMDEGSVEISPT
jgi:hypothetical protein